MPADISEDRMGFFFAKYGQVDEVGVVMSKSSIGTVNIVFQVTLTDRALARSLMC